MFKRTTSTALHDPVELMGQPTISYVNVTPAIAEQWLKSNTVNRKVRPRRVTQYAADMSAGRWTLGSDLICFSSDGLLLNGQHRLHAVIASGCTVAFAVQHNTPREAMSNMDTGAARVIGDVFGFRGEEHSSLLGSAVKFLILVESGRIYQDNRVQGVSHSEILDYVEHNPGVRHSVKTAQATYRLVDCPPTVLAAAHFLIGKAAGVPAADDFLYRLRERTGEPTGSPVLALDRRLREIRRLRQAYQNRDFLALVIKAYNYCVRGETVRTLAIAQTGKFTIPAPTVRSSK